MAQSVRCMPCEGRQRSKKMRAGSRVLNSDGYVLIYPPDSADATGYSGEQKLEHRFVMAEHLGRPLLPGENVHHKNGVRDDNRIENLELWTTMQPRGKRVVDLLDWAREIIDTYGPIEHQV